MSTVPAINVTPKCEFGNRCSIITWGIPTNVATPGGQSNTPKDLLTADLDGGSIYPTPVAITSAVTAIAPVFIAPFLDRCIQFTGTAGGATFAVEGSNDGTNYVTLHDAFGNALGAVVPGTVYQLMESTAWLQIVMGGSPSGTTSVAAILKMRAPF